MKYLAITFLTGCVTWIAVMYAWQVSMDQDIKDLQDKVQTLEMRFEQE